jgi:hypothetical protein
VSRGGCHELLKQRVNGFGRGDGEPDFGRLFVQINGKKRSKGLLVVDHLADPLLGAAENCRAAPFCVKCARHFLSLLGDLRGKKISQSPRMDDTGCSRTKEVSKVQNTDRKNRTRAEENRRRDATEGV